MKSRYLFPLWVSVVCGAVLLSQAAAQPQDKPQPSDDDRPLAKLQLLRQKAAREFVTAVQREYETGIRPVEHLIQAHQELHDAKLDLSQAADERVQNHEQHVENLRALEKGIEAKRKIGARGGSSASYLAAKVARLKAEVELARARQKP